VPLLGAFLRVTLTAACVQALYKQWLPLIVIVGVGLIVLVLRFLL
jgi:hypothetical protein